MKPIAYFPQCMWQSMLNFTAYLQSLTGFSWDKTGLTLYTAYAVLRHLQAYGLSVKLLQTIQFHIWPMNNIFFKVSESLIQDASFFIFESCFGDIFL